MSIDRYTPTTIKCQLLCNASPVMAVVAMADGLDYYHVNLICVCYIEPPSALSCQLVLGALCPYIHNSMLACEWGVAVSIVCACVTAPWF